MNEPSWFSNKRQIAEHLIEELPFPKMPHLKENELAFPTNDQLNFITSKSSPQLSENSNFVQVGTKTVKINVSAEMKHKGVILTDIFSALDKYPKLIKKYFMSEAVSEKENKFVAQNLAYLNSGLFLYLPKNVQLSDPIEVELVQDSQNKANWYSHLLIVAEENSSVRFLQHLTTIGNLSNYANMIVEIIAQANSKVDFSSVEELSHKTKFYFNRKALVKKDAHVQWAIGLMNGSSTVGQIDSELVGEGSYANSQLIAVTSNGQKVFINNRVTNHGPHSTGLINQRGVLLDKSHLIFNGVGQIIHGAHGSKADQQNRVLMMSPDARGDANPLLLIDENDVIAAHAASVGPVDQIQMDYLMSRGIPYEQAQRLVIRGFLGAVLDAIPTKDVRQKMINLLERKLINGQKYSSN